MIKLRRLHCSFCRKDHTEVSKLVAGPRVYICDQCVAIASRLMSDDSNQASPPQTSETVWHKLSTRVRRLFDSGEAHLIGTPDSLSHR
jgi:ATP-dependent protease Clp ATPase subunit